MSTVAAEFAPSLTYSLLAETPEFYCGTEYEIESIKKCDFGYGPIHIGDLHDKDPYWVGQIGCMKDGSLRNNGAEFITKPVKFNDALDLFTEIHKALTLGPDAYSHRTSIHVHVNVASMSLDSLRLLLHTYALLEPVFFRVAGETRTHNIHCVPLNYTLMPTHYRDSFSTILERWSKYTAFNMCPVRTQGTVEFRHLYGTGDKDIYKLWLTLIRELWTFAQTKPKDTLRKWLYQDVPTLFIKNQVLPSSSSMLMNEADFAPNRIDVKLGYL